MLLHTAMIHVRVARYVCEKKHSRISASIDKNNILIKHKV